MVQWARGCGLCVRCCGGFSAVGGCSGLGVLVWWPCVVVVSLVRCQLVIAGVVVVYVLLVVGVVLASGACCASAKSWCGSEEGPQRVG